jgi:hypothetical protein
LFSDFEDGEEMLNAPLGYERMTARARFRVPKRASVSVAAICP